MQSPNPKINQKESFPFTKKKTASLLLIISLLCSAFFAAGISYAQSGIGNQKYPTGYSTGGPSGAYDYLVFTFTNNTGTYYAAKDSFGKIIDAWTSTNASYVFTQAINNGRTFISSGQYYINNTIVLTSTAIYVEGAGNGNAGISTNTELILGANANCDMFQFQQSPSGFVVLPYFAHFKCTGNYEQQDGGFYCAFNQINNAVVDPFFEDIWFNRWSGYAINLISGWDIRISRCQFENSQTYGVCLNASTAFLDNVVIEGCYFATGGTSETKQGGVIGAYTGSSYWPTGVTITNCVFKGTVEAGNTGNPWIIPVGKNWVISNNQAISSGTFVALIGSSKYYIGININNNNIDLLQGYGFYNNITYYEATNLIIANNVFTGTPHVTRSPTSAIYLGRTNSSLITNNMIGSRLQCDIFSSYAIDLRVLGYNNTIINNVIQSAIFPNGTISDVHASSIGNTVANNYIQ